MIIRDSSKNPIQIDNYRIISQLGKGGFGTVYNVFDTDDKKEYALKLLYSSYNIDRLLKQFTLLKLLNNSNLFLKTYTTKKVLNHVYIVSELAARKNLDKQIAQNGCMSEKQSLQVLSDMLNALEFLHNNNYIHGDIKAENIVFKKNQYYLIDFDISKKVTHGKVLHILNDDDFCAPEIYHGYQTPASDIYALGCVLYFVLTSKYPYDFTKETSFSAKMFAHLYSNVTFPKEMSSKMKNIIQKMMIKDAKKRATIAELKLLIQKDSIEEVLPVKAPCNYNFKTEKECYQYMAQNGVAYAQNILGLIFEEENDIQNTLKYYKLAASKGLVKAYFNLGLCYKLGKVVKQDFLKAFEYFLFASDQGHARSYFQIAEIYEKGLGRNKDMVKAKEYYKKARYYGYKPAYTKSH